MSQVIMFASGVIPPGGFVQTLTGNDAVAVGPDGAGNINVIGAPTSGAIFTGNAGTFTESLSFNFLEIPNTDNLGNGIISMLGIPHFSNYGVGNIFVGSFSGNTTLTILNSSLNTGIGAFTLFSLTDGAANFAGGYLSLNLLTTGTGNTACGFEVLPQITTGANNTGVGANCMNSLTAGSSYNTCLGAGTLSGLLTGTNNIAIGYGTGQALNAAQSSNILIGKSSVGLVGDSNTIRIGETGVGAGQQSTCYIAAIDGVNVGSTAKVVTMGTGGTVDQLGTATVTAGAGISVTPGANTITIAATGMGAFAWSVIVANQTAAVNNGYLCNKGGTLALALPALSAVGDVIEVTNENTALGVQFTQAAGQQILIGNTNTTLGATGTLTSSAVGDTLKIVCYVANTIWRVTSVVGNWTPA